jgi:release factor glutamine methyltransferase
VLGLRRIDLYLQHERALREAELAPYRELTARRASGEPVAYLTGHKEFMGLDFEVTPAVLVPNPDTEPLVQRAVSRMRERRGEGSVADVGTGSGCIAVAIAHYVPGVRVLGTDLDPQALEVARRNAARHHVQDRVELLLGDLLEPVPGHLDLVCANPPYLPEGADLPAEVRAQPRRALFGGPTGSEVAERLLRAAADRLAPGGALLVELDPRSGQPELVALARTLYAGARVHQEPGGAARILEAWNS